MKRRPTEGGTIVRKPVRQPAGALRNSGSPDALRLLHELRVHQVELEVQNTELAQSRAEAERAVARYTELYDLAPVAYLTMTPDGRITQWNRAAGRLLGLDQRRRGVRLAACVHPDDVAEFDVFLRGVFAREPVPSTSLRLGVKGGRRTTAQIEAVLSAGGDECRAVLIETTERHRLEELESELNQARKIHAIGRLAAGAAHEINNELASIMALLALPAGRTSRSAETRRLLGRVEGCVERAAGVVRKLLLFGHPAPLDIRRADVNAVIRDLLGFLRKTIGEDFEMGFEGGDALPAVEADTGLLQQAILNLVLNARDAMPGGGRILLKTALQTVKGSVTRGHPDRRAGRFVTVSVADHGCGIRSKDLGRIFEPFFTTKKPGGGTGLGLPMVRDTVAQHQGWVEVESRPGSGSVFRIFLPAAREGGPVTVQRPDRDRTPPVGGKETLLLVEDSESLRETLREYLTALGYRVQTAGSGAEAVRVWRKGRAALLLADMIMPGGMTGRQLAERLRRDEPGLPVIISSGYTSRDTEGDTQGIVFIPKPSSLAALGAAIRVALDAKKAD